MERKTFSTGSKWEPLVGYSRGVRVGNIIEIAGTTSSDGTKIHGLGDAYEQAKHILATIESAVKELGGELRHVVRTRVYLKNISDWQAVGNAHAEYFGGIRPASTMLAVSDFVHEDMLVEIEACAIIEDGI